MKTFLTLFVTSLFLGSMIFPLYSYAAASTDYQMLAPIPGLVVSPGSGTTTIAAFLPGVAKLMVGLAAAFAVFMLIWGGIQYMSTDAVSGKSDGRETITNAVIGLLLAIGAFTILNTINPRLLSLNLKLPYVGSTAPIGTDLGLTDTPADPTNWVAGASWPDDSQGRAALLAAHITVNKNNCLKIGDAGCTSVYGLGTVISDHLFAAESACESWNQNCRIRISGGTEYWLHAGSGQKETTATLSKTAHKPWGNVVDLSLTGYDIFHNFLKAKGTVVPPPPPPAPCTPGSERYNYNGGLYVNEVIPGNDPHWHVCF